MPTVRLYIIRHGETHENRVGIIQGHMDTQLNEQGISQAAVVAATMEKAPLTDAWSSDLQRAVKTAEIIIEKHPGLRLVSTKKLRERGLGHLEGKHHTEKRKLLSQFPGGVDPAAEGVGAMHERLMNWWDTEVLGLTKTPVPSRTGPASGHSSNDVAQQESTTADTHHVLVVSHGGFIGSLVNRLIETGRISSGRTQPLRGSDFICFNTSITTVDVDEEGRGNLVKYGDISHMLQAVKEGKVLDRNVDVPLEGRKAESGEWVAEPRQSLAVDRS
ncbi:hypothetical protein AAF712_005864 [Marasmius tenuissimus]|uniref:Phosphoglycerate mutase-like protein n=1 Tax=Marasmius tenuissimus TaxID=585030 RepID=A0ABR3A3D7_9AGAR